VETAMMGKVAEYSKEKLSSLLFETISFIKEDGGFSKKNLKIIKSKGGNIDDSFIVKGIVLDKNPANSNMEKVYIDPKILLVDFPLEVPELDTDAKINLNSLEEYEAFINNEKEFLRTIVYKIKQIGTKVIICQKGIDDGVAYYLAKEGILAIRRTKKSDMEKLSLAINSPIISNIDDLLEENLGFCKKVEVKEIQNEKYIFIEDCPNPKAVSLFLKASNMHTLDELDRAIEDSLGDLNSIIKSKRIVAGGSSIEMALYTNLIKYSKSLEGKESLIAKTYAESFLEIPKVLCENCGFDEIETISSLTLLHETGKNKSGLNGFEGIVEDTSKIGIIEPINVKEQAIKSALEACASILRIDDIIAAKKLKEDKIIEKSWD
ncbi:thermosome subunit, partial [bacterium]|nr:thermosome subunit [bacterium]